MDHPQYVLVNLHNQLKHFITAFMGLCFFYTSTNYLALQFSVHLFIAFVNQRKTAAYSTYHEIDGTRANHSVACQQSPPPHKRIKHRQTRSMLLLDQQRNFHTPQDHAFRPTLSQPIHHTKITAPSTPP